MAHETHSLLHRQLRVLWKRARSRARASYEKPSLARFAKEVKGKKGKASTSGWSTTFTTHNQIAVESLGKARLFETNLVIQIL